jgi:hypothetical protein
MASSRMTVVAGMSATVITPPERPPLRVRILIKWSGAVVVTTSLAIAKRYGNSSVLYADLRWLRTVAYPPHYHLLVGHDHAC